MIFSTKNRFSLLYNFIVIVLSFSFLTRLLLFLFSFQYLDFSFISTLKIFGLGLYFDFAVAIFFSTIYCLYLVTMPTKYIGKKADKIITYIMVSLMLFLFLFGIAGEFPFWEEFSVRYNFIAVDYLIYTYEVVQNINQSYPIPLILIVLFSLIFAIWYFFKKKGVLSATFSTKTPFKKRLMSAIVILGIGFLFILFAKNEQAEWSDNTYKNELSKNGIFSLFAAYLSNELDYDKFYKTIPQQEAYSILKKNLIQPNQKYISSDNTNITRQIQNDSEQKPNIILITIESLSAEFLGTFGNKEHLTPFIDSLANESILFTQMYATGTRTVRGMEALTLSIPPTPGNSIVRRPNNENLCSIASIMKQKKYQLNFIYGGDGYFDNMNYFFGNQGFDIIDRDRNNPLSETITTERIPIKDSEVTFENAWGICDEDLYNQALKRANLQSKNNRPFFQFIMTTSNHRPYSFPENSIDMPQGKRESAVRYTDYALEKFIRKAQKSEWFANTVFVIVADHCASSAGKWELNVDKHHIPALIYNLNQKKEHVNKLVSQIDLMPTLFGLLNWNYESQLYGKNIYLMKQNEQRALIGNYRTLGLLKNNILTQLNERKMSEQFVWNNNDKTLTQVKNNVDSLISETISYYQTASERFKNGKMKTK
ncbi:MAG: sulfatase-like hydrolase/transferase [Flavobacteriales bacterium]|nr:sulfatase-like hydrolase/transferase [Flavobacteriales bacterium]